METKFWFIPVFLISCHDKSEETDSFSRNFKYLPKNGFNYNFHKWLQLLKLPFFF